ncbi:MAG: diaminobutyrate acetyltransferase [Gammaproteobacteria bacterium]|nr:MAG: diaminobutyrate acetyltransferase [Gammaproteobacteria bacterium]
MSPEALARTPAPDVRFRAARPEDGAAMWQLVHDMGGLELNTAYFYVLFCIDFAETCVVAETPDGRMAGFVLGHRPPARPDTVFVWQVGVAPWMRRQGLAGRLLEALLGQQSRPARWLEATVSPDNSASMQLFRALARSRGVRCEESDFMPARLFPGDHAAERLFRIGPLNSIPAQEQTS